MPGTRGGTLARLRIRGRFVSRTVRERATGFIIELARRSGLAFLALRLESTEKAKIVAT